VVLFLVEFAAVRLCTDIEIVSAWVVACGNWWRSPLRKLISLFIFALFLAAYQHNKSVEVELIEIPATLAIIGGIVVVAFFAIVVVAQQAAVRATTSGSSVAW